MATWKLKGEAGKGLDDTARSVQALGLTSGVLTTATLADDSFIYTYKTTSPQGAGIDGVVRIPTAGQVVELFLDSARKFKGHAMLPEVGPDSVTVRVLGPWYWMRKIPLLADAAGAVDTGTDADGKRPTLALAAGPLRDSLRLIVNAARDAGVPVQNIGSGEVGDFIDNMFQVLKTTLSGGTWADALIEMMKWCLDAVVWWDYTASTPKIRITRRGNMTAKTLTVGVEILEGMRINPSIELAPQRVDLHYATRHPVTGRPRWATQSSGGAAPDPGRLLIVPVSGADLADLVPKDDFDTAMMRTLSGPTPDNDYVAKRAGTISSLISSNGRYGAIGRYVEGYDGTSWEVAKFVGYDFGPVRVLNPDGTKAATSGKYLLLSNDQPEWFSKAPIKAKKVKITGNWVGIYEWGASYVVTSPPPAGWLAWYAAAPSKGQWWKYEKLGSTSVPVNKKWFAIPFECEGVLVSVSHTTKTKVYRPWEWDYLDVPANLASNLADCMNFTRWEGTIPTYETVTGENLMQYKIKVANSASGHSTMNALCKSVAQDILNNRITYTLGAPAPLDYKAMIARLMSKRIDRVRYL